MGTSRLENSYVSNGTLKIVARREDYENRKYTSARLTTKLKQDWRYGRIEVRARLPLGGGSWSAIWMLPTHWKHGSWPTSGELDIMEHVGNSPHQVHASAHSLQHNFKGSGAKDAQTCADVSEWQIYSLEWSETEISAYVNSKKFFTYSKPSDWSIGNWPYDEDFHLMLNVAVGGSWGEKGGGIDEDAFRGVGQIMEIDYVRVYA